MHNELIYQSGISNALGVGWDVMHVIYKENGTIQGSFVIARDAHGTIMRKTDILLERWEIVSDTEKLRAFQEQFDIRDKLATEKASSAAA